MKIIWMEEGEANIECDCGHEIALFLDDNKCSQCGRVWRLIQRIEQVGEICRGTEALKEGE